MSPSTKFPSLHWQGSAVISAAIMVFYLIWLIILPEFRTNSAFPAMLPLFPVVVGSGGYLFFAAAQRKKWATATLFSIVIIGLTLNFRDREPGDIGPDWQNGLKAFAWIALTSLGLIRWRELFAIIRQPVPALLGAHACVALASTLWSPVPLYTAASAIGLFAYLSFAGLLSIDLDTNQTLKILLWSLFAFLMLGVVGAVVTPDLTWLAPSVEESGYRLQGFAGHPNNLGHYAGLFLIAVFVCFDRKLISRKAFVSLILFAAFILFETGSRTICIALLLTLIAISLRQSRYGGRLILGATALATLVLCAIALGGVPEFFDMLKRRETSLRLGVQWHGRNDDGECQPLILWKFRQRPQHVSPIGHVAWLNWSGTHVGHSRHLDLPVRHLP